MQIALQSMLPDFELAVQTVSLADLSLSLCSSPVSQPQYLELFTETYALLNCLIDNCA